MKKRASIFLSFVVSSILACGSDPAPGPATPTAASSTAVGPNATPPTTIASTDPSQRDIVACLGAVNTNGAEACKSCVLATCLDPVRAVGAACPAFTQCTCNGSPMSTCLPMLITPECSQAGIAVGACAHQNCGSQCIPPASAISTATPPTSPTATDADPCAALATCCAHLPANVSGACTQIVGQKNPAACSPMLSAFRGAKECD